MENIKIVGMNKTEFVKGMSHAFSGFFGQSKIKHTEKDP